MRVRLFAPIVVLIATALAGGCDRSVSTEWNQWRGPDRSGVSTDTGLLKQWPDDGPPRLWTATGLGDGYSAVSVAGGTVYTMGQREDHGDWLFALSLDDGTERWSHRLGDAYENRRGDGPRSTPTVVGGRVYALGPAGDLWCLTTDGEPVWQVNLLDRFGTENIRWGLSESPLVEAGLVVVATGSADGSIVAFDAASGEPVWQSEGMTDGPSYASAIVVEVGGVRQIVHQTDSATVGIRLRDGEPMWRYERASNDTANCTTPVYHDGRVFVTSGYDTGAALLELTREGDATSAEEVYFTRDMINHHGGVVLVDGHLYGYSNRKLVCLDFATGKKRWEARGPGKGSIAAADGMLYVFSERGDLALAVASPEQYWKTSSFQVADEHKTWAHPVITGGRLFVRVEDELHCYDVRA